MMIKETELLYNSLLVYVLGIKQFNHHQASQGFAGGSDQVLSLFQKANPPKSQSDFTLKKL